MLSKNKIKYIHSLELKKTRKEEQVFLAEGPKLTGDLLGHFPCRFLAATSSWLQAHPDIQANEIAEVSQEELSRASLLKTGILTLMISAAFSSLQVLVIVIERLFSLDLSLMKSTMLLASVIFIVISSCIYVSEVQVSVKALGLTVHHHNRPQ